jgi:ATP-dependent RNA helicase RhlE
MSFESLGLKAELLRAIDEQGYTEPTPIQAQAIPLVLQGRDIMAGAQTGTGKTAGFTLPMLQLLSERPKERTARSVRVLVLTPTRELAAQVADSIETYGRHLPHRAAVVFGGVNINPQISRLRSGIEVLIATPGRLLDHVQRGTVDLSEVEMLVLDEADRMLDMGFIHDIRRIVKCLPGTEDRQSLMFSATFPGEIRKLAGQMLNRPELVEVAAPNATVERIEQVVHPVEKHRKRELLSHLVGAGNWQQVLVFTRTKHGANRLARQLEADGLSATAIHGNKTQAARTRALADFKQGRVRVLVATDIAARGLDIDHLPYVVNFELPNVPEDYVHRIGRTGRAGREGKALSLVARDEWKLLGGIEKLLRSKVPQQVLEGYEAGTRAANSDYHDSGRGNERGAGQNSDRKPRRNGRKPVRARNGNGGNGNLGNNNGCNGNGGKRRTERPAVQLVREQRPARSEGNRPAASAKAGFSNLADRYFED